MMNRRESREFVFKLLYESCFHEDAELSVVYKTALEERDAKENDYVKKVFFGVCENRSEIDEIIRKNSIGWKVDRISRIALAVMRLSVYEMLYMSDIPYNISINEALELIKRYDVESARTFGNGILDAVSKSLKKEK